MVDPAMIDLVSSEAWVQIPPLPLVIMTAVVSSDRGLLVG